MFERDAARFFSLSAVFWLRMSAKTVLAGSDDWDVISRENVCDSC